MRWSDNEQTEKAKFLENPGKWVYWHKLGFQRRREDEGIRHNEEMQDIYEHFQTWANRAQEWAVEAGLIEENEDVFTLEEIPDDD